MLSDLTVLADLRGHRVDVSWTWSGLGERPAFRLVRRRRAYPADARDGVPVLDLGALFREPDAPWARLSRVRWLAGGSVAEGGLVQAEALFWHAGEADDAPAVIEVRVDAAAAGGPGASRVEEVSRVELAEAAAAPWGAVETLEIFHTPGGGAEASAGTLTVFRDHDDGVTPPRLRWEPAGEPSVEVELDAGELHQTVPQIVELTATEVDVRWTRRLRTDAWTLEAALSDPEDAPADALVEDARVLLHEAYSGDTGDWTRAFEVEDVGAALEETSYYRLFHPDPSDPGRWTGERDWRGHASATARYGFESRVYGMLPSVHRFYDEPTPEEHGSGQLRRFLEVFGVALDSVRSGAESLHRRHDVHEVRGDFLPALGSWIDWTADRTQPLDVQRTEIRTAPDVYETVGTLPNIVALARRVTGWPCRAKEFVENLFLTNAPEHVPIRELWETTHDGTGFGVPVRLEETFSLDARPAPALEAGGRRWLFFHSNRSGRWEIWVRTDDGGTVEGPVPLEPAPADELPPTHADLSPAALVHPGASGDELWVFWSSDRDGPWNLWARVHDGTAWGEPTRITDHPAADRRPAAATGAAGTLWLFWESERRGPSEIWARTREGDRWSPPVRVTAGPGRDREPAAALGPDGRLHLVWRRDEADRSRLYTQAFEAGAWGPAEPLEDGPWRDESPTLVARGAELWLVWSSLRTGRWELWGRVLTAGAWGDPFQITQSPDPDKEPVALLDGTDLRISWRSERPSREHRSRTVDTGDTGLLERFGRFTDRIHYTYDTARETLDWYARDVVGLYLAPPPGTSDAQVLDVFERAASYLEPFTPATVRLVLVADRPVESLGFATDGVPPGDWIEDAFDDVIE